MIKYNDTKVLLDCGNGITRYLNIPDDLEDLTIIISHLHSDHYGDLNSIASTTKVLNRLGLISDKIKVYIPEDEKITVKEHYTDKDGWGCLRYVEKSIIDYDYILSLEKNGHLEFETYYENEPLYINDLKISFCRNPHQVPTYSIKVEANDLSLVYSSDTGYKNNTLVKFSKDANLLICESTYLKGQSRNTDDHLYAFEAAKIAKSANVDELLLTHFWPNISKDKYVNEAKKFFENTSASEENKKLVLRRKKYE